MEIRYFDQYADVDVSKNRLPHWNQDNATYFVTFRVKDAIPAARLTECTAEREAWLGAHKEPWSAADEAEYNQRFPRRIEEWLDAGHGSCPLRDPRNAGCVGDSLLYFESRRTLQHSFIVMPNHVHALFSILDGSDLDVLIQSWKRFTARKIAEGPLWQKDYFDRLIRDEAHFWNCARYIRRNPTKARLRAGESLLWEHSLVAGGLDAEL